MEPDNFSPTPFITRKMLSFEHGIAFSLQLRSHGVTGTQIKIQGVTKEGPFTLTQTVSATGAEVSNTFRIPDIPIFLSVVDTDLSINQGQCFVRVSLLANGVEIRQLTTGYVYQFHSVAWPEYAAPDMVPNHGFFKTVSGADPAANVEATLSVASNELWRILKFTVTLVTDANAANRRVHFVIGSGATSSIDCFSTVDQTASLTRKYSVAAYGAVPDETDDDDIIVAMPQDMWLVSGGTIATATVSRQATDNFGVISALVESFWQPEI